MSALPPQNQDRPGCTTSRVIRSWVPEAKAQDVSDLLRKSGLRPTQQRLSLAKLLFSQGNRHVSAEMILAEAINARVPVSLATVYNTLNQFTEAGLLREVASQGSKSYFDTNLSEHHHFIIEGEHTVIDIPGDAITLAAMPEPPEGTEIERVEVIVRLKRKKR